MYRLKYIYLLNLNCALFDNYVQNMLTARQTLFDVKVLGDSENAEGVGIGDVTVFLVLSPAGLTG